MSRDSPSPTYSDKLKKNMKSRVEDYSWYLCRSSGDPHQHSEKQNKVFEILEQLCQLGETRLYVHLTNIREWVSILQDQDHNYGKISTPMQVIDLVLHYCRLTTYCLNQAEFDTVDLTDWASGWVAIIETTIASDRQLMRSLYDMAEEVSAKHGGGALPEKGLPAICASPTPSYSPTVSDSPNPLESSCTTKEDHNDSNVTATDKAVPTSMQGDMSKEETTEAVTVFKNAIVLTNETIASAMDRSKDGDMNSLLETWKTIVAMQTDSLDKMCKLNDVAKTSKRVDNSLVVQVPAEATADAAMATAVSVMDVTVEAPKATETVFHGIESDPDSATENKQTCDTAHDEKEETQDTDVDELYNEKHWYPSKAARDAMARQFYKNGIKGVPPPHWWPSPGAFEAYARQQGRSSNPQELA